MPPVIATAEVGRAAAEVFAYATDPVRSPNGKSASPKATSTIPALRRPAPGA
jgi:hypothetical protein